MSSSQFSRGKQQYRNTEIDRLVDRKQLTQDGADWATLRLDPYHDFERSLSGYPDSDSLDTVVSCFNYEQTVTKPVGLALGDWDLHVFTLPFTTADFTVGTTAAQNHTQGVDPYSLGLVNIAKSAAGDPLFPTTDPVVPADFTVAAMDAFTAIEDGVSRVIGFGIELIDTTAELYKQGVLLAYKMPSHVPGATSLGYLNQAATMECQISPIFVSAPPSTLAQAVQYKSSVTWEAREGMYMAVGQVGVDNPLRQSQYQGLGISDSGTSQNGVCLVSNYFASTALQAPPITTAAYASRYKWVNCTQSGAFMCGLANSASIRVRVRVYVERAPLKGDTSLIPLATPSPSYDYKALALYSCAVSSLPVAVPVHFNAKGDWWRWIVRVIGAVAPSLGAVLNPVLPGASAIGNTVGSIARKIVPSAQKASNNTTAKAKPSATKKSAKK